MENPESQGPLLKQILDNVTDPSALIKILDQNLGHKAQLAVVSVALGVLAVIGLAKLMEIWRSFRARKSILEEQKLFNEILKIRYEIEILRKQHDLPDLIAADRVLGPGAHPASPGEVGDTRTHKLLGFSLPELPSFSFDLLSIVGLSRKRPDPGMARVIWSIKWLAAIFVALLVLLPLDFLLLPQGTDPKAPATSGMTVGITLVLLAAAVGAYLLSVTLYNLILLGVRAIRPAAVVKS